MLTQTSNNKRKYKVIINEKSWVKIKEDVKTTATLIT